MDNVGYGSLAFLTVVNPNSEKRMEFEEELGIKASTTEEMPKY